MNDLTPHRPDLSTGPLRLSPRRAMGRAFGSWCLSLGLLLGMEAGASAQGFRLSAEAPSVAPRIPGARNLSTDLQLKGQQTTADYILAVVNAEPITYTEVDKRVARVLDTAGRNAKLPSADVLRQQVLEALIDEKIQLQFAKSTGLTVSDAEVDNAVSNIASQNQITLEELRSRMKADGLDYERYRHSLREQITLERVRDREVNARIQISDAEADAFIAQSAAVGRDADLTLAHILLVVPEGSTPEKTAALAKKAETLRQRAASGANFAKLAKEFSEDTNTKAQGGALGTRAAAKLPELFTDAVKDLKVGEVSKVVRSGAGFHIIKLIERENASQASYTQQRARHILVRTTPQLSIKAARERLAEVRKQIVGGQSSFAQMARQYSEDGSASKGGELGWAVPGQFVPEFEKALLALQPGEVSEPVVTRFGVHLIQLIERREVQLTAEQKREAARSMLREQRFEAAYEDWARDLRGAAFVEMRDAP